MTSASGRDDEEGSSQRGVEPTLRAEETTMKRTAGMVMMMAAVGIVACGCAVSRSTTGRDSVKFGTSEPPRVSTNVTTDSTQPQSGRRRELMVAGDMLGQQVFHERPTPAEADSAYANVPNE